MHTKALQTLMAHTPDVLLLASVARDIVVHELATLTTVLDVTEVQEVLLPVYREEWVRGCVRFPCFRGRHASVTPVKVFTITGHIDQRGPSCEAGQKTHLDTADTCTSYP